MFFKWLMNQSAGKSHSNSISQLTACKSSSRSLWISFTVVIMAECMSDKWEKRQDSSPCHDNEEVQAVPCVTKVTLWSKYPQGYHFNDHLHSKEGEDAVIKCLWTKKKNSFISIIEKDRHFTYCRRQNMRWGKTIIFQYKFSSHLVFPHHHVPLGALYRQRTTKVAL